MTFGTKDDVGEFSNEADHHNGSIFDWYSDASYKWRKSSVPCCQCTMLSVYHVVSVPCCQCTMLSVYHVVSVPCCQCTMLSVYHVVSVTCQCNMSV